jgi:hypothetical protein
MPMRLTVGTRYAGQTSWWLHGENNRVVAAYVPHREENPDPDDAAVIVIARSTQEAIVINLAELYSLSDQPSGWG